MMLLNPGQRSAEAGQGGMAKRTYECLKFVNRLKRLSIRHDRSDFNNLHLLASELATIATGCFQIDNQPVIRFVFHRVLES